MHSVPCVVCNVQCAVWSVQFVVCNVQCVVSSVKCELCSVQRADINETIEWHHQGPNLDNYTVPLPLLLNNLKCIWLLYSFKCNFQIRHKLKLILENFSVIKVWYYSGQICPLCVVLFVAYIHSVPKKTLLHFIALIYTPQCTPLRWVEIARLYFQVASVKTVCSNYEVCYEQNQPIFLALLGKVLSPEMCYKKWSQNFWHDICGILRQI